LDIIINPNDVLQGHGRPKWYEGNADAIMISSLSVLKLQLQANVMLLNGCSNFHLLLLEMMKAGCGADPNYFQELETLNEIQDPKYRICCARSQDNICASIWTEHNAKTNVTAIKLMHAKNRNGKSDVNLH
jgi:hypothetical protein